MTQFACVVVFIDNEAPTVYCIEDLSIKTDRRKPTAMVIWEDLRASDNSGNVSVACDPPSGTSFTIGKTVVICEGADNSGNKAQCYFSVNVTGKYFVFITSFRVLLEMWFMERFYDRDIYGLGWVRV